MTDSQMRAYGRANPLLAVAITGVVIAACCAGWFGWSWFSAAHSRSLSYARTRDLVLQAGEQAIQNFNTLDYRHVSQGLHIWQESSTGSLRSEITAGSAQFGQQVEKAKTITTAKILDGAVTALDVQAGTATVLVALQITVIPASGTPSTKPSRLEGQLSRTAAGWKLSALGQVPVGTAAPTTGRSTRP